MADNLLSEEESLLRNTVRDYSNDVLATRAADYDESGLSRGITSKNLVIWVF